MPKCVAFGAKLKCSFGNKSVDMMVLPLNKTITAMFKPLANKMDFIPALNVPSFGLCLSPANPLNWKMAGPVPVFVPSTCIPVAFSPWNPVAKKTKIGGQPAMLETSKTTCAFAGSIKVDDPGQTSVEAN